MLPFLGHGDKGAERGVKLALIGANGLSFFVLISVGIADSLFFLSFFFSYFSVLLRCAKKISGNQGKLVRRGVAGCVSALPTEHPQPRL
jgi:hypothetical protein